MVVWFGHEGVVTSAVGQFGLLSRELSTDVVGRVARFPRLLRDLKFSVLVLLRPYSASLADMMQRLAKQGRPGAVSSLLKAAERPCVRSATWTRARVVHRALW